MNAQRLQFIGNMVLFCVRSYEFDVRDLVEIETRLKHQLADQRQAGRMLNAHQFAHQFWHKVVNTGKASNMLNEHSLRVLLCLASLQLKGKPLKC
jgi:hypothetical protein